MRSHATISVAYSVIILQSLKVENQCRHRFRSSLAFETLETNLGVTPEHPLRCELVSLTNEEELAAR